MAQIGSDEKPVTFRKSIYGKSNGGKGARPRPGFYTQQYKDNWDLIFGKPKGLDIKGEDNAKNEKE
jgi:hypothetical protein